MPILDILLLAVIAAALGTALLLRGKTPGAGGINMLAVTIVIWSVAALSFAFVPELFPLKFLKSINYLCLTLAAYGQLFFAFVYTNRARWINPTVVSFFAIEPVLTQLFYWVDPINSVLFDQQIRIWEQVNLIYVSHVLAASLFLFMDTFLNKPRSHFMRAGVIFLGSAIPMIANILLLTMRDLGDQNLYISIFSYSFALAGFIYGTYSSRIVEKKPITRNAVVESMDDGWMVIDNQEKIIDLNSAAEDMINKSRDETYGLPVDQILGNWHEILQSSAGAKEMEIKRKDKDQNNWRYLNVRISQLFNHDNTQFGHLVVWRDITERKLAEDARMRARDELLGLLTAISSLANRSMKMEDFLLESSFQIIYSFHSQAVAVFLMTEEKESSLQKLSMQSQFGFPAEYTKMIGSKFIAANIHQWLQSNEESRPLILDENSRPKETPFKPKEIGFNYVALIPLSIYTQHENTILGCMCLGRNEEGPYTQDEIIRLTTIANQIAILIDSDRRRQLSIALSERQRLLRDLHDSVSQKLYGLVALTEAAQAGIEAGATIEPLGVLTRIGENARQAVKEMRLFLYQMQPMDLEEGLVSSLQHRLAAVEGRADIKARLISDDNIQLDKEHEIALYYIAQEALNNILRHAHAKNVTLNLKKNRQNVLLEITDDGQGFSMKKIDNSGLGLRNMRERAEQANGKFKITSKVGAGTKIMVTVARKS